MQEQSKNLITDKDKWRDIENEHDKDIRDKIGQIFQGKTIYFASDYPDPNHDYSNQGSNRDPINYLNSYNNPYVFHEIAYINKTHLEEIKAKQAFLVCEYFKECSPSYLNTMYVKCIKSGIPTGQVIIIGSSIDFKKHAKKLADLYKVEPFDIVYYPFWARATKRELLLDSISDTNIDINSSFKILEDLVPLKNVRCTDPLKLNNFKKKFIFLNHMPRPHRALMLVLLNSYDLLKHGYVSYLSSDRNFFNLKFENLTKLFLDHKQFAKGLDVVNKIPLYVDEYLKIHKPVVIKSMHPSKKIPTLPTGVDPYGRGFLTLHDYINHSFLNVVSERYFNTKEKNGESQSIFITEKTFKAIAFKQPFVIISLPGTLQLLKKMGYKTFSPWIDESYDLIEDPLDRLHKICLEVKRIVELDENTLDEYRHHLIPIIEHNYELLMNNKNFFYYPVG